MSQADANSFLERLATSEAMRRDVQNEVQVGIADRSPEHLVQLGVRYGLSFTTMELADALAHTQTAGHAELSGAELEAVSGGLQMAMDRTSKMYSTLSNFLNKVSDTSSSIVQNLK